MLRACVLAAATFVGFTFMSVTALADQFDKKTILTTSQAIQVPGKVLPPGTYVIKLLNSLSNRHIVQIFNEDETEVLTTILAIPNYRLEPTGDTHFGFWEVPVGKVVPLKSWFYPGDNFGQEFAYPKETAVEIAQETKQPVPVVHAEKEADLPTAELGMVEPSGKETALEAVPPAPASSEPAPAPAVEPLTPAPESERSRQAESLPETASNVPLIGLLGLISLGVGFSLRAASRHLS
jgi:hypothetical protein